MVRCGERRAREVMISAVEVGPEVVAPLRDAVRLVHHHQPHLRLSRRLHQSPSAQPLRRDVQQPQLAAYQAAVHMGVGPPIACASEVVGWHVRGASEPIHLIFHQRDQR